MTRDDARVILVRVLDRAVRARGRVTTPRGNPLSWLGDADRTQLAEAVELGAPRGYAEFFTPELDIPF